MAQFYARNLQGIHRFRGSLERIPLAGARRGPSLWNRLGAICATFWRGGSRSRHSEFLQRFRSSVGAPRGSAIFSSIGVWPNHEVTAAMIDKANEILKKLEAPHLADRFVTEMSSGEARRIVIGRALVHDPMALLLDEPSTSLDIPAQHELSQILRKLAQSGVGILLVTHHLSDIIPEIERVILLRDGEVAGDGRKEDLLTEDKLTRLFGRPVDLVRRDGYFHAW
ncbi:MAG: ATP-binding cassette domain-containing protein [Bryobacteraceae bacterium]